MCLTVRSGASPCLGRKGRGHQHLQTVSSIGDGSFRNTTWCHPPRPRIPKAQQMRQGSSKLKYRIHQYDLKTLWCVYPDLLKCHDAQVQYSFSICILTYVWLRVWGKTVCYKCEKNAETSWIGKWTSSIKLKCDSLYVISSFPMFYTMFCGFKKRNETMWLIHKKSSKGNNLEI